ncbi:MAG: hypothetical protein IAG13_26260 [Deltaproteobacteria bacterium]|nr:hypothetical protein [Nannocystaceae bacterium]
MTMIAIATPACSNLHERRATTPSVEAGNQTVSARVEERRGKRYGTWKPYVAALVLGAVVGASAMVWKGFLDPNRPLAVTGLVLVTTLPVLGSLPFLVKQGTPWTRTKWDTWRPAPGVDARLDVIGGFHEVVVRREVASGSDGGLHIELGDSLCKSGLHLADAYVDLVVTVPDAESSARASVPARGLAGQCETRLTLMPAAPVEEQPHGT